MATSPASGGTEPFLTDIELRPFRLADEPGLVPVGLAIGQGRGGLEVAVTRSAHRSTQQVMRTAWNVRHGGRAVPLLLVTLFGDRAAICGPGGDEPPVYLDLDRGMVERLCRAAFTEPDRHAASRFLRAAIPELETPLPPLSPALSVPIVIAWLRLTVMLPCNPTLRSAAAPGALGTAAPQLAASSQP